MESCLSSTLCPSYLRREPFLYVPPARELNQVSPTSEIICSLIAARGRKLFMVRPEKIFLLTQEEHCSQRKPEHSGKRKKKIFEAFPTKSLERLAYFQPQDSRLKKCVPTCLQSTTAAVRSFPPPLDRRGIWKMCQASHPVCSRAALGEELVTSSHQQRRECGGTRMAAETSLASLVPFCCALLTNV